MGKMSMRRGWIGGVALVAALVGAIVISVASSEPASTAYADIEAAVADARDSLGPAPNLAVDVYETIAPSIVIVEAQGGNRELDGSGLGAGVIINADGSILTSYHVVADATHIEVTFGDGTRSPAKVVSAAPANDIATLLTDRRPEIFAPAVIGSARRLQIGDPAFVVGHPLGFAGSLSAGVISGFERTVPISDELELTGLIQFDAAVNPGSSGGPLVNQAGQVIGIVTALATTTDASGFSGIGLAVPISAAIGGGGGGPAQ